MNLYFEVTNSETEGQESRGCRHGHRTRTGRVRLGHRPSGGRETGATARNRTKPDSEGYPAKKEALPRQGRGVPFGTQKRIPQISTQSGQEICQRPAETVSENLNRQLICFEGCPLDRPGEFVLFNDVCELDRG